MKSKLAKIFLYIYTGKDPLLTGLILFVASVIVLVASTLIITLFNL